MERRDTRPFQQEASTSEQRQNVIELESHKSLRHKIHELIDLTNVSTLTTHELQNHLSLCATNYGKPFTTHLTRSLLCDDEDERDAIVWLLLQLNDLTTIPILQQMTQNEHLSRAIRLSASLALAGMGITREQKTCIRASC